ncbi:uncharacterized protein [Clytia hemisphaerica]|uniref:Peptidase metallopeptidase domain-containing protein n=1 Tax=Clytia hemisphaerica TaxID=252671 RepID=A0A7M5V8L5_9CNID
MVPVYRLFLLVIVSQLALVVHSQVISASLREKIKKLKRTPQRSFLKWGYLNTDSFSESMEIPAENIKDFQNYANLPETGILDDATVDQLSKPRCGLPENVEQINARRGRRRNKGKKKNANETDDENEDDYNRSGRSRRYLQQGTSWLPLFQKTGKNELKWTLENSGRTLDSSIIKINLRKAFDFWSQVTNLIFIEIPESQVGEPGFEKNDIEILVSFVTGQHNDPYWFDGPDGTLAHAFYPLTNVGLSGDIHFDDDENYTIQSKDGYNFLWVAVHEIGHSIGLEHSDFDDAVMYPWFTAYDPDLQLSLDDIFGIQSIYGAKDVPQTATTTTATTTTTTTPTPEPPLVITEQDLIDTTDTFEVTKTPSTTRATTTATTTTTTTTPTTTTTTTIPTTTTTTPTTTTTIPTTTTTTTIPTTTITTTPTTTTTIPTTTTTIPTTTTTTPTTTTTIPTTTTTVPTTTITTIPTTTTTIPTTTTTIPTTTTTTPTTTTTIPTTTTTTTITTTTITTTPTTTTTIPTTTTTIPTTTTTITTIPTTTTTVPTTTITTTPTTTTTIPTTTTTIPTTTTTITTIPTTTTTVPTTTITTTPTTTTTTPTMTITTPTTTITTTKSQSKSKSQSNRRCPTGITTAIFDAKRYGLKIGFTNTNKMYFLGYRNSLPTFNRYSYFKRRHVPGNIDAVLANDFGKKKNLIVFSGKRYVIYNNFDHISGPHSISEGTTDPLNFNFPRYVSKIDAALFWPRNRRTYFFAGTQYWRYNNKKNDFDKGYPKDISRAWRGLPSSIDAAYSPPDKSKTIFFARNRVYVFDTRKFRVQSDYGVERLLECDGAPKIPELGESEDELIQSSNIKTLLRLSDP